MHLPHLAPLGTLVALSGALAAQQSAVFVGRFDFVSLDAPNERPGGSLTALSGFDLSFVTFGSGAVARAWLPTTGIQAMMGDPLGDGSYTKVGAYPNDFDWSGPFVRFADRGKPNPPVFWTVRDDRSTTPPVSFKLFTGNGTQVQTLRRGDFFRCTHNGNVELFVTQALLVKADGTDPQGRAESPGADCLVQDAAGNLYYSPPEGGTWVLGNDPAIPQFCGRAGIIMIDAQSITYDAAGNVQDVAADSAHIVFGGYQQPGPNGEPSLPDMVAQAAAMNYLGSPIVITSASSYYNTVGLALDPNGGTTLASIPRMVGGVPVRDTLPHLLFHSDNGTYGGTVFSTAPVQGSAPAGSIAVINGVKMGSDINGVPATGTWWGVQQATGSFQPTLMGFALLDAAPPFGGPFAADAPAHGAVQPTDTTVYVDLLPGPSLPVFLVLDSGPAGPSLFAPSLDLSFLLGPSSFSHLYPSLVTGVVLGLGIGNPAGYSSFAAPNPQNPSHKGLTLLWQGVRLTGGAPDISNPVIMQFK